MPRVYASALRHDRREGGTLDFFNFGRKRKTEKPCILVADDVATIRAIVRGIASQMGFVTYEVWEGEGALDLARQHRPKLILLDLNMSGMDGLSTLKALKSDPEVSAIPVVILSGNKDPEVIASAKEAGALDFVIKDGLGNVTSGIRRHLEAVGGKRAAT